MASVTPPKLHGLITIDSTNDVFTITATSGAESGLARTITLTQGNYFIQGYTGETHGAWPAASSTATGGLLEHVQAQVRAAPGTAFDSFTASALTDTGRVSLSNTLGGDNFTINGAEWYPASGGLGRILGFAGDITNQPSLTGPNHHKYSWYPNVPPVEFSGDPDLLGVRLSDAVGTTAPDGTHTTTAYNNRRVRDFTFEHIADEYMMPTGSLVNRDFEQFWTDILRVGRRWRYYPDRTVQTAPGGGAPWTYVGGKAIARDGTTAAERQVAFWSAFYKITIDALEYIG